ncbi:hypothetical protein D3C85_518480 [compost metagenome]
MYGANPYVDSLLWQTKNYPVVKRLRSSLLAGGLIVYTTFIDYVQRSFLFAIITTMATVFTKLIGNTLYFIGALMVVLPVIAFVASAGMVLLAGYSFFLIPIVGAILATVGKSMIKNAQRIDEEDKANEELMAKGMRDISNEEGTNSTADRL